MWLGNFYFWVAQKRYLQSSAYHHLRVWQYLDVFGSLHDSYWSLNSLMQIFLASELSLSLRPGWNRSREVGGPDDIWRRFRWRDREIRKLHAVWVHKGDGVTWQKWCECSWDFVYKRSFISVYFSDFFIKLATAARMQQWVSGIMTCWKWSLLLVKLKSRKPTTRSENLMDSFSKWFWQSEGNQNMDSEDRVIGIGVMAYAPTHSPQGGSSVSSRQKPNGWRGQCQVSEVGKCIPGECVVRSAWAALLKWQTYRASLGAIANLTSLGCNPFLWIRKKHYFSNIFPRNDV